MHNTLFQLLLAASLALLIGACADSGSNNSKTAMTVHSIALPEGNSGELTAMDFRVSMNRPVDTAVTLAYRTEAGSATEGEDYYGVSGEVMLTAGELEQVIRVELIGDDIEEDAEQFFLRLKVSGKVSLTQTTAIGTLANDDSRCDQPYVASPNPWLVGDGDVMNYAHRGGVIDFPENTLYAYKKVAEAHADVLEMDVYQTADNQLVILHDLDVDRTTNGTGNVGALTLAELKALDAAYWFVTDEGTPHDADPTAYEFRGIATGDKAPPAGYTADDFKIPTLEEALMAFPDQLINIELKPDLDGTGNYEQQIADLLVRYGRFTNVIAASFVDEAAANFKAVAPCIHTSVPLGQATDMVLASFGDGVMPAAPEHVALQVPPDTSQVQQVPDGITVVTEDLVKDAHAVGLAVQVWTINDCEQMLEMMGYGVDAIMTDRPLLLQSLLEQPAGERSCGGED